MTVPAASHEQGVSLPRRRTLVRSWMVLVLALLGALLALLLGGLKGAQLASASPLPNTYVAAQRSASSTMQVDGSAEVRLAGDQRRSTGSLTPDGVTPPSPRVTPKSSVVGPMRRSDHGTPLVAEQAALGGVPADVANLAMPVLTVLLGGAILVLRGNPL